MDECAYLHHTETLSSCAALCSFAFVVFNNNSQGLCLHVLADTHTHTLSFHFNTRPLPLLVHCCTDAEDEWFLPGTPGDVVRIHAEKKGSKPGYTTYRAGQVPGFTGNLPPVDVGGVEVSCHNQCTDYPFSHLTSSFNPALKPSTANAMSHHCRFTWSCHILPVCRCLMAALAMPPLAHPTPSRGKLCQNMPWQRIMLVRGSRERWCCPATDHGGAYVCLPCLPLQRE